MADPFESYDDLDDFEDRLQAADASERRVAIIALANSGDPAAVVHLDRMTLDPDPGVRQQVALALGEFDGPDAAAALVKVVVAPGQAVADAAPDSLAELEHPPCASAIPPFLSPNHPLLRLGSPPP